MAFGGGEEGKRRQDWVEEGMSGPKSGRLAVPFTAGTHAALQAKQPDMELLCSL